MARGNLVLCRKVNQSVFIGEGEHQVTITVVDANGLGTLSFREKGDTAIRRIDPRIIYVMVGGVETLVTTVECDGRTVKLAFQAEKSFPIDREEIRKIKQG